MLVYILLVLFLAKRSVNCEQVVLRPIHDVATVKNEVENPADIANAEPIIIQPPQIVAFQPLLSTIRQEHYVFVHEFHLWCTPVTYMEACCLVTIFYKSIE